MSYRHINTLRHLGLAFHLALIGIPIPVHAAGSVVVRVMAANLPGDSQTYGATQIRILQGLKPDVVALQEFNYAGEVRTFVNLAFGTNFSYFRESGYSIPNGIISRFPILSSGSWADTVQSSPNRGFAWAQLDLPGTTELYVVSVHFLTSSSANRANEAANLKALIQSNFPANAWIVVAGDLNTDGRDETALFTLTNSFLRDQPIPTDAENEGNPNTNLNRNKPYDYVLTSPSLAAHLTNVVFASRSFSNGLIFDSREYTPLSDVAPALFADSANGQHMAVLKDLLISTEGADTNAPSITTQPQPITVPHGSNATFTVVAAGANPLSYQWRLQATNLATATASTYSRTNVQAIHAGEYSVVVTNLYGSTTSSPALLTVHSAPIIIAQPQSFSVKPGSNAMFSVFATGPEPLSYQWRFNNVDRLGATASTYTITNAQATNAGNYTVVITSSFGSITSATAVLTVNTNPPGNPGILAGWDVSALSNYGTSPLSPTTNAPNLTIVGLTRGGGVGTSGTAAARAWGGNGFDTASAANAVSAGDHATFTITAQTGYKVSFTAISRFDYRRSGTGPPQGVLQYQIGNGAFADISPLAYPTSTSGGASLSAIDLSPVGPLQDVPAGSSVTFRIANYAASGAGGTWYLYDLANNTAPDFALEGIVASALSPSNPPAAMPTLSQPAFSGDAFTFTLNGTPGTNYVVQFATNLANGNWTSLRTNAAPFSFTDSNPAAFSERYYRALWQP